MRADLHIHTTASDGRFQPQDIIRIAAGKNMNIIAITDHDTVAGIPEALEAAKKYPGLTVIPGVEISTDVPQGEVHVLGYFIDYNRREFVARLEVFRASRLTRARKMVEKLAGLGIKIEWERVKAIAGTATIGRPHVAKAMMEKGYISSLKEAFEKYIGRQGPAYVERYKMTPPEAVMLIKEFQGIPVLAHPDNIPDLERTVISLKSAGLAGVEAYYAGYTPDVIVRLIKLSEKNGLFATGGSDYHGLDASEVQIGEVSVAEDGIVALLNAAGSRAKTDLKLLTKKLQ